MSGRRISYVKLTDIGQHIWVMFNSTFVADNIAKMKSHFYGIQLRKLFI